MNNPNESNLRTCIYCNKAGLTTDDHVIPDCLFPKPIPVTMQALITVPACKQCQLELSKHQDYLRDVLVTDHFASNNVSAQKLLSGKVIRSVRRNSSDLARDLELKSRWEPMHTPGGVYMQHLITVPLEEKRLVYLFSMMVKGLYYSKFKQRLPDDCLIEVKRTHPFGCHDFWEIVRQMQSVNGPYVWGDVFACMFLYGLEDTAVTAWSLLFYESTLIQVSTRTKNYDENFKRLDNDAPEFIVT